MSTFNDAQAAWLNQSGDGVRPPEPTLTAGALELMLERMEANPAKIETTGLLRFHCARKDLRFSISLFSATPSLVVLGATWKTDTRYSEAEMLARCNRLNEFQSLTKLCWHSEQHELFVTAEFIVLNLEQLECVLVPYLDAIAANGNAALA